MADREVKVTVDIAQTGGLAGPGAAFASLPPSNPATMPGGSFSGIAGKSNGFDAFARGVLSRLQQIAENTGASGGGLSPGSKLNPEAEPASKRQQSFGSGFETSFTNLRNISSSLTGLASSSAPLTVSTLAGSVQLLAGEITSLLIPGMNRVSLVVQSMADKFHDLDDKTRGAISRLGEVAGPILGAAAGMGVLATVVRPVVSTFSAMSASPMGIAGMVTAGVVSALASTDRGRDALGKLAEALTPLVDAFADVIDSLSPVVDALANVVKEIAPFIKSIAEQMAPRAVPANHTAIAGGEFAIRHGSIADWLSQQFTTRPGSIAAAVMSPGGPHPTNGGNRHRLAGSAIFGHTQTYGGAGDMYSAMLAESLGKDEMSIRLMNNQIDNQMIQIRVLEAINRAVGGIAAAPGMPTDSATPVASAVMSGWGSVFGGR